MATLPGGGDDWFNDDVGSQGARILATLRRGNSITPIEALRQYGCFRLAARIYDLRKIGFDIVTIREHSNRKQCARYRMIAEPPPVHRGAKKRPRHGGDRGQGYKL